MRKVVIVGLVALSFVSVIHAAQRGAVGHVGPAPVVHSMAIAPSGGGHSAPARMPGQGYVSIHQAAGTARPAVTRHPTSHPVLPYPGPVLRPSGINSAFNPGFPNVPNGNGYPVPGFGFDYTHFFAVHPEWGRHHFVSGVVVPFAGFGGFYLPIPYYDYSEPEPQEAIAASNNVAPEASQTSDQPTAAIEPPAEPPRESTFTPLKAVPEYVFVKRDGTKVFAVAYSLTSDKLAYITREGLRRTMTLDALDYDATEKSNEERGNTVNLPKPVASSVV